MTVEQLLVIDAKQVQHGCLIIVGGNFIDDSPVAKLVGFAKSKATLNAAASQPSAEALAIVVASRFVEGAVVFRDGQEQEEMITKTPAREITVAQ